MGLFFEIRFLDCIAIVAGLFGVFYLYWLSAMNYWKRRGVATVEPEFFFGNTKDVFFFRKNLAYVYADIYKKLPNEKYFGVYQGIRPAFVVKDPDMIRTVLVKDFSHFVDRSFTISDDNDPLRSKNLFFLKGAPWKTMRAVISPTFTSGKIKRMFSLIYKCSDDLVRYFEKAAENGASIEIRDSAARYTTDVIASCAFGVDADSLKNPKAHFRMVLKEMMEDSSVARKFKSALMIYIPSLFKLLKLKMIRDKHSKFFFNLVSDTMDYREKNGFSRNDFMDLMIQLKKKGKVDDDEDDVSSKETATAPKAELTEVDIAAQAFAFLVGGFETSSTTMTYALYELSLNPDTQKKLQEEIDDTLEKYDGKLTYEAINEMTYLDMAVSETFRKYPAATALSRLCTKTYTIPGTRTIIDEGTSVSIPVYAIHYDEKYYPNPKKFDPERFSEQNKKERPNYTFFPFGEGPRNCVGLRFGLLQTKLGLARLLAEYNFSVCKETPIPLVLRTIGLVLTPTGGVSLKVQKRK